MKCPTCNGLGEVVGEMEYGKLVCLICKRIDDTVSECPDCKKLVCGQCFEDEKCCKKVKN